LVISGKLQKTIPKPVLIFSDNFPGQAVCLRRVALKTSAKPAFQNGTSKDAACLWLLGRSHNCQTSLYPWTLEL
jgi:hypothetical protein